ncbi:MAG TPA: cupin domain-containing protein [Actinomycetota bacterium]|nr:cupin domain-containing protein [Actinomycetota bacterium]
MSGNNGHGSSVPQSVQLWGGSIVFREAGDDVDVAELTADPGFAPTPHVHHRHHERFFVLEGSFEFLVGDEVVHAGPGAFIDVPPGVVHDFHNPGPGPARLLGLVSPGGLNGYFLEVERHILEGTLNEATLAALRVRFQTDNVPLVWRPEPSRAEG